MSEADWAADHIVEGMQDAWDLGEWSPKEGLWESLPKTCRYCKEGWLHWKLTEAGWRLADTRGEIHVCKAHNEIKFKDTPLHRG